MKDVFSPITDFIFIDDNYKKADIILVPGCEYPQGAELAADLYKKGYAKKILPSGKFAISQNKFDSVKQKSEIYNGEYQTEWEFMFDILTKNGVNPQDILKEDCAQNTYENAIFSQKSIQNASIEVNTAIIACKFQHARRCKMYYQLALPQVELFIANYVINDLTKYNWYNSQDKIRKVMGEMRRIGEQFANDKPKLNTELK